MTNNKVQIKGAKLFLNSLALFVVFFIIILDRLSKWFILNNPDFYSGELIGLRLLEFDPS